MRFAALLLLLSANAFAARTEIRHGRFYVDDEPFYVRAVGYAPWRPHQHPGIEYANTNRRWTDLDFARMKAAHFNTVRTWHALSGEELALARKHGLMVLQGIWLDPKQDFSDPHNQDSAVAIVRNVAEESKDHDNVLGYLIMTEPWPQAVLETGEVETMQYFRRLKRAIQAVDPRPVSMDAWTPLAFLNLEEFDFVTVNIFAFWPKSLNHALGFAGLTRWFADRFALDRPLIIGETGGYSVSKSTQGKAGGAGGYSEYEQSVKNLESLRETVEGHAWGAALVSWIDTWHYPRDPDTHDDEPWEWNGILGIATDKRKDMDGVPRRVYQDVTLYNEVIVLDPKANHIYPVDKAISIQAVGASNVAAMRFSVNNGDWKPLSSSGKGWFQGTFKLPKLARKRQLVTVLAQDKNGEPLARKDVSFLSAVLPEIVEVRNKGDRPNALQFSALVTDGQKKPIPNRKVYFGCFYPISMRESFGMLTTNTKGEVAIACTESPRAEDAYVFVAAGTDSPERVRAGDMKIFSLGR
jgi:hypothetical protein